LFFDPFGLPRLVPELCFFGEELWLAVRLDFAVSVVVFVGVDVACFFDLRGEISAPMNVTKRCHAPHINLLTVDKNDEQKRKNQLISSLCQF
tara:strand:+ start:71 stop:346 length:276 start_codon:yes stop_codon:yes gene_type:complete